MSYTYNIKPLSYYKYLSGNSMRKYTSKEGVEYKRILQEKFKDIEMIKGRIDVEIHFIFDNKRKNDLDNFAKVVLDCLGGVAFEDDRYIYKLLLTKEDGAERPSFTLRIKQIL